MQAMYLGGAALLERRGSERSADRDTATRTGFLERQRGSNGSDPETAVASSDFSEHLEPQVDQADQDPTDPSTPSADPPTMAVSTDPQTQAPDQGLAATGLIIFTGDLSGLLPQEAGLTGQAGLPKAIAGILPTIPQVQAPVQTLNPGTLVQSAAPTPIDGNAQMVAAAPVAAPAPVDKPTGTNPLLRAALPGESKTKVQTGAEQQEDDLLEKTVPAPASTVPAESDATAMVEEKPAEDQTPPGLEAGKNPALRSERPRPAEVERSPEPSPADKAVAGQVARATVRMLESGNRILSLRLTPPELGTVRIEVIERPQGLTVRVGAEDDAVRSALERALPTLRQELRGSDAPVRDIDLADSFLAFDQRQAPGQQQSPTHDQQPRSETRFDLGGPAPLRTGPPPRRSRQQRVDETGVDTTV